MSSDSVGEKNGEARFLASSIKVLTEDSREWRNSTICSALDGGSAFSAWIRKAQTSSCQDSPKNCSEILVTYSYTRVASESRNINSEIVVTTHADEISTHGETFSTCSRRTITKQQSPWTCAFYCQCRRSPTALMEIFFAILLCAEHGFLFFRVDWKTTKNLPATAHVHANLHARSQTCRTPVQEKNLRVFHLIENQFQSSTKTQKNDANAAKFPKQTGKLCQLSILGSVNIDFNLPAFTETFPGKRH